MVVVTQDQKHVKSIELDGHKVVGGTWPWPWVEEFVSPRTELSTRKTLIRKDILNEATLLESPSQSLNVRLQKIRSDLSLPTESGVI
ncbi:hypothetical protein V6N12_002758 [Hibiscus sabdariffa]|uniref:Uncharacterized protein n=1 Tax=Hibiscus sabdariffa TaxID=183260 RepID=A0ABR2E9X0_9ROSI